MGLDTVKINCYCNEKLFNIKDLEYGALFKLLGNYIPLVFSIYRTNFKQIIFQNTSEP